MVIRDVLRRIRLTIYAISAIIFFAFVEMFINLASLHFPSFQKIRETVFAEWYVTIVTPLVFIIACFAIHQLLKIRKRRGERTNV